jgi:hypothetical protein
MNHIPRSGVSSRLRRGVIIYSWIAHYWTTLCVTTSRSLARDCRCRWLWVPYPLSRRAVFHCSLCYIRHRFVFYGSCILGWIINLISRSGVGRLPCGGSCSLILHWWATFWVTPCVRLARASSPCRLCAPLHVAVWFLMDFFFCIADVYLAGCVSIEHCWATLCVTAASITTIWLLGARKNKELLFLCVKNCSSV